MYEPVDESAETSKEVKKLTKDYKLHKKALNDFNEAWYNLLDAYSEGVEDSKGNELTLNEDYPFKEAMEDIDVNKWIKTQLSLLK
jgi:hypothetical protein